MSETAIRLLLVDDEELNRDMLSRRLKKLGYAVCPACDGQRALGLLETHAFDLVLLDVMMPGLSGLEVLARIRQRFSQVELPVIMVTAKSDEQDVAQALRQGANDYVAKPIAFEVLKARLEAQISRKQAELRYRQIVEKTGDVVYTTDAQGRFTFFNARFQIVAGCEPERYLGKPFTQLLPPEQRRKAAAFYLRQAKDRVRETVKDWPFVREDGTQIWIEQTVTLLEEGDQITGFQAIVRDISGRKALENELQRVAIHDSLTGLFNRRHLDSVLEIELDRAVRYQRPLSLLALDLDGFKAINDRLSHVRGDAVLQGVAQVIGHTLRKSDTAFRFGGDEFVILLPETNGKATQVIERLQTAFQRWVEIQELSGLPLGLSVGRVTWVPGMEPTPESLLKQADAALYQHKSSRDITKMQRQLAASGQAQLEKTEQDRLQSTFLNNVNELVAAITLDGELFYTNHAFDRWRAQAGSASGNKLPEGVPCLAKLWRRLQAGDWSQEKISLNGCAHSVLFSPSELKTERGRPFGYALLGSDITALEQASQQVQQSQRFLERLNTETHLDAMLQRIVEEAVALVPAADSGSAQLFNPETGYLEFVAATGWDLAVLKSVKIHFNPDPLHTPQQHAPSVIQESWEELDPQHLDPQTIQRLRAIGYPQSTMSIPIVVDNRFVGKLNLDSKARQRAFSEQDLALVSALLLQIQLAVKRASQRTELERLTLSLRQQQRFLEQLNAQMQLPLVLELILKEVVAQTLHADSGSVLLLNERTGLYEYTAAVGWNINDLKGISIAPDQMIQRQRFDDQPAIIDDMAQHMQASWSQAELAVLQRVALPKTTLTVPIRYESATIGYFNIDSRTKTEAFTQDDLAQLRAQLPIIELAVRRAKQQTQLESHQQRLEVALQLGQELAKCETEDDVCKLASDWAVERFGYDLVGIALVRDGLLKAMAFTGSDLAKDFVGKTIPLDTPALTTAAYNSGQPQVVEDVAHHPQYYPIDPRTRSELAMPIRNNHQTLGVFNFEFFRTMTFGGPDFQLASFLANQVAVAVGGIQRGLALQQAERRHHLNQARGFREIARLEAQLLEQTQQELHQRNLAQRALQYRLKFETLIAQISSRLIGLTGPDLDEDINSALGKLGRFLRADRAHLFLINPAEQTIHKSHQWVRAGTPTPRNPIQHANLAQLSWWADQLRANRPILLTDIDRLPPEAAMELRALKTQGIKSVMAVPLQFGDRWLGFVGMHSVRTRRRWRQDDVNLLLVLAKLFAQALEHRRATEALQTSEERFRNLVENIHEILFSVDAQGVITYVSPVIELHSGYRPAEVVGRYFLEFVHPEDHAALSVNYNKVLEGVFSPSEYRLLNKDGHTLWVQSASRPIFEDGKVVGLSGMLNVINERKIAEARQAELRRQLEETAIQTATMLARSIEEKDPDTAGHCERLAKVAVQLGKSLKLDADRLEALRYAALLHDVGKVGVPEHILNKPGALDATEWRQMQAHVDIGVNLVSGIRSLTPAAAIIAQHHERLDGSGYPLGLKGEAISLEGRILALVDVWDALRSNRPYRPAWSERRVRDYLCQHAGKHFDAKVVSAFFKQLKPRPRRRS